MITKTSLDEQIAAYRSQGEQLQAGLTHLDQQYAQQKEMFQHTLQQVIGAIAALEALKEHADDDPNTLKAAEVPQQSTAAILE